MSYQRKTLEVVAKSDNRDLQEEKVLMAGTYLERIIVIKVQSHLEKKDK